MTTTPEPRVKTVQDRIESYWDRMGRLNLLTGVIGSEKIKRDIDQSLKNQEAENAHVRKTVWGSDEGNEVADDNMRDTVLGDIIHPTPIIYPTPPQKQSWVGPIVLGALLGCGLPAAAYLGYQAAKEPVPSESSFNDESVSIGLGRIEDYATDNKDE
jgi:hypothetical protein